MNFRIGQKVVCINSDGWFVEDKKVDGDGPKYNEVTTISDIGTKNGQTLLSFEEYGPQFGEPSQYYSDQFRPIVSIAIAEEIKEASAIEVHEEYFQEL